MSLRQGLPTNRNAEADRTTYTSNVTTTPSHPPSDRDPDKTGFSLTDTLSVAETAEVLVATPNHSKRPSGNSSPPPLIIVWILLVYYWIYVEDETIPSKTPVAPGDPF